MFKTIKQILKDMIDAVIICIEILNGTSDCNVEKFINRQYLYTKSIEEKMLKMSELQELIEFGLDEMSRIGEELDSLTDENEIKRLEIAFTNLEKELTIVENWYYDLSHDVKYLEYKIHNS